MITPTQKLIALIKAFDNIDHLEKTVDLDRITIYRILDGDTCGSKVIANMLNWTGWNFEDAFDTKDTEDDKRE